MISWTLGKDLVFHFEQSVFCNKTLNMSLCCYRNNIALNEGTSALLSTNLI